MMIVSSPRFSECDALLEKARSFDGVLILCGDISECYEIARIDKEVVGVPSLLSDTYEVKLFRELGALAMGRWLNVRGWCVGGVDAKNAIQCIDRLVSTLGSCVGPRIVVSTQRLGYLDVVGYPSAADICSSLGALAVVVCGQGEGFCLEPRVTYLDSCAVIEACCRPATIVNLAARGTVVEVGARCLEL